MAEQLGDRVKHFFTINEFRTFVETGYRGSDVQVAGPRGRTRSSNKNRGWTLVRLVGWN